MIWHFQGHYNPMAYLETDEDAIKLAFAMHEKCNVNDFVERFGVSRRTITSDIVVLTRKHNIRSKSGPHGGIEIDRDLKTDEVPYLTDFETSWLKRKYDEAEIEEDRIAAHSILRRFSL